MLGGTLAAGGANAINMYVDRDIDRLMERTKGRPLVTGAMSPRGPPSPSPSRSRSSPSLFLWATVNLLSAVLAVAACLFYVFVYTLWLKRTSTRNIVIGGAAGAVPTLIGWSSVTGTLDWAPVVLFAIIFYWTPAALLGPGHPLPGRLRRRRRADAARSVVSLRRTVGPDPRLHAAAVGAHRRCSRRWPGMGHLYLGSAIVLGADVHLVRRPAAPDARSRAQR